MLECNKLICILPHDKAYKYKLYKCTWLYYDIIQIQDAWYGQKELSHVINVNATNNLFSVNRLFSVVNIA